MSDLLNRLDAAIDGKCPCGADPRPGSAYCGDDCTPTHRSVHTTSDTDGTQMRWRPDLVTAVDDTGLTLIGSNVFYDGRYNARLFQRGPEIDGMVTWHLRLDDGYRFVGADLTGVGPVDEEIEQRVAEKWAALDRELTNGRHVEPDTDPWADVMEQILARANQRWADDVANYGRLLDNAARISGAGQPVTYEFAEGRQARELTEPSNQLIPPRDMVPHWAWMLSPPVLPSNFLRITNI